MAFLDQNSENALHISKRMEGARVVETCMLSLLVVLSGFLTGLTLAKDSYHLLTTLSLLNIIAIGSIPVVAQGVIQNNLQSALISTAALLVFATIIPQSVCLPYALPVAGWLGPAVQFLIWITFPLTWPIARLLEWTFGNQIPPRFRRYELRELVRQHRTDVDGDLDIFTAEMTWNALTLSLHTARHVMVPIHKAFMIPLGRQLDYKTFCEIQEAGWSRIILYTEGEDGRTILGYILSKNLILENPQTRTPMDKQILYELPLVAAQEPLTNVLKVLLERQRHMALVYHPKSTFSDDESSVIATTWKERFQSKIAARVCRGEVDTEDSEKAINSEQRSMASVNTRFDDSTTRRSGKATLHPRIQVEPIGSISTQGSDGHSTRRSFHTNGQEGMTAIYVPKFEQFPDAKYLTSRLKRTRSCRRFSYSHQELIEMEGHVSASLVRQRLGLGEPPPSSHRAD
ncbi:hypothetical protein CcaverHIS631_0305580 [Cutaneotrichosporon cavernicola]|nr:hypothetical protein CcaverHIS631_0305580 [Cutaneotrichosporon cavernicola]